MPERAGCKLPSRVRVPSGKTMIGVARATSVQDLAQARRAAAFAIDRHGIPRAQSAPMPGKRNKVSRAR